MGARSDDKDEVDEEEQGDLASAEACWPPPSGSMAHHSIDTSTMDRVPIVTAEDVKFIGEDAPTWQPVPDNWMVFGIPPNLSANACTADAKGKPRTIAVENVQLRIDEAAFKFEYRTIPFL